MHLGAYLYHKEPLKKGDQHYQKYQVMPVLKFVVLKKNHNDLQNYLKYLVDGSYEAFELG